MNMMITMDRTATIETVKAAAKRIKPYTHKTPIHTSSLLNEMVGASLYFKCENFQKVGAFKFRGACNSVFSLDDEAAKKGVATHSAGNHAAALALGAKLRGIPAYIVMPSNASEVKKQAVACYGGVITYCEPTLAARETYLAKVIEMTDAHFIHPYDNYDVISGAGTAALELVQDVKDLAAVIAPVGGGGLLAGTAISVSQVSPNTEIIAAEPEAADDACRSFQAGKIIPSVDPITICDGLLTSLGDLTFPIIRQYVDKIFTAPETQIIDAMRLIWERMKIIVEPSAAVGLAIILQNKKYFAGKKVGLILSGGNVDINKVATYM
jgi:threonine dehydratase